MLIRIWNDAPVPILDALGKGIVVIVYTIIGNIVSCQVVYFQLMLRRLLIDPLRSSLRSGARN
jgi:hypothetical protein